MYYLLVLQQTGESRLCHPRQTSLYPVEQRLALPLPICVHLGVCLLSILLEGDERMYPFARNGQSVKPRNTGYILTNERRLEPAAGMPCGRQFHMDFNQIDLQHITALLPSNRESIFTSFGTKP